MIYCPASTLSCDAESYGIIDEAFAVIYLHSREMFNSDTA